MKTVAMDIETDDLDAKHIWIIVAQDVDTGAVDVFRNLTSDPAEAMRFKHYCHQADKFVFYNGIGFDVPVINRLLGNTISLQKVIDTLIVSRLADYDIAGGHSLDAWGKRLGPF